MSSQLERDLEALRADLDDIEAILATLGGQMHADHEIVPLLQVRMEATLSALRMALRVLDAQKP